MRSFKIIIGIILCLFIMLWGGIRIYKGIHFDIEAGGHLKRAADANTVEIATKEMDTTIKYLEANNLTKGYTSILYRNPDEDIEFWYNNLKSANEELKKVDLNATQLEKSNILMKLRETLLDSGEKSSSITIPEGISIYPNNIFYCFFGWLSTLFLFGGVILVILALDDY